jgi:hypothetical protein
MIAGGHGTLTGQADRLPRPRRADPDAALEPLLRALTVAPPLGSPAAAALLVALPPCLRKPRATEAPEASARDG